MARRPLFRVENPTRHGALDASELDTVADLFVVGYDLFFVCIHHHQRLRRYQGDWSVGAAAGDLRKRTRDRVRGAVLFDLQYYSPCEPRQEKAEPPENAFSHTGKLTYETI